MPMPNAGAILYLRALTALHPGAGAALGAVDLPVQRERHTNWPMIPGASIKGVLRDACAESLRKRLFGEGDETGTSAGALSFTDARLLGFPVRSLKGVFAWVTCPQALERWKRDAALVGLAVGWNGAEFGEDEALVSRNSPCLHEGRIILEEFCFHCKHASLEFFPLLKNFERPRLAVIDDSAFSHFVQYATEVTARIRLEDETKTVKEKHLFYQEFLPAETLLYSLVLAADARDGSNVKAEQNLRDFQPPPFLQIGGDETTGKGLCELELKTREGADAA